jgi:hypothetical protein
LKTEFIEWADGNTIGPTYRYDSHTRLALERKEDMRRRGVPLAGRVGRVRAHLRGAGAQRGVPARIEYPNLGLA